MYQAGSATFRVRNDDRRLMFPGLPGAWVDDTTLGNATSLPVLTP